MNADAQFEESLQALLDGRRLRALGGSDDGARDAGHGGSIAGPPSGVGALRVLDEIARVHRLALFGEDGDGREAAPGHWGHLDIGDEVGRGASGTVYRAWDPKLAREVALKLFDHDVASADTALAEGRLLARLRHPHIVSVFGGDVHDGVAGVWMEFVHGDTLDEVLARDGVFGVEEALLAGIDLASALSSVHAAGLLHRDVKARNVVRERGGRLVLMDLGAGRLANETPTSGDSTGTPLYMAPEVLAGGPASVGSDLYGLGVLLYRLLTDAFPLVAPGLNELRAAHRDGRVVAVASQRPDLPPVVAHLVDRACDPDPARRPASAADLEAELREALRQVVDARVVVRTSAARAWARWRRAVLTAGASMFTLLAVLATGWNTNPGRAARRALGLTVPPKSPLYLTIGGAVGVVRDGRLDLIPGNPAPAHAVAVSSDEGIRTAAGVPIWTSNAQFDLDGRPRAQGPATLDGLCCFYDGATDGRHNYAVRQDSTILEPIGSRPLDPPTLYRFARDWTRPEPLFVLGPGVTDPQVGTYYAGVAYDHGSDSFWIPRNGRDAATIEQWDRDGRRVWVSAPVAWTFGGIALDPADGTLWAIQQVTNSIEIRLDNFDRAGRHLATITVPRPTSPNGAIGAEFAWTGPR